MTAYAPFPLIDLEGTPRERGRQHGQAAADRLRRGAKMYAESLLNSGVDWNELEKRAEALQKAAEARRERAAVKARLKDSTGRRGEEIRSVIEEAETNEVIGRLRVTALLESLPGVGKVKARKVMEEVGIADNRRVQGLGQQQKSALLEQFGK